MNDNETGADVLDEIRHWLIARPPWPYGTTEYLLKRSLMEIVRLREHTQSFYLTGREHAFDDAIIACENHYAFACAEAIRALKKAPP